MRKKDMYVDYNISSKRNRRNRRPNPRNYFLILIVIILAIVLGYGGYLLAEEGKIPFNISFNDKEKETTELEDEDLEVDPHDNNNNDQVKTGEQESNQESEQLDSSVDKTNKPTESSEETSNIQNPNKVSKRKDPVKAKGIYVSGPVAGSKDRMGKLIDLVNETELNAMIIDLKNDNGEITYKMDHDLVKEINADINYISDMEQLIKELKELDIYLIARIVAFKDPLLAKNKPEFSLKYSDGSIFYDNAGQAWVNPYNEEVWEYLVEISLEAAEIGFDEIQFDYIRFSTDSGIDNVDFGPKVEGKDKIQIINEFTKYAYEKLSPYVYVSADVYGAIIDSEIDQKRVGQDYLEMAKHLDYICPMIYPSHYADGSYSIEYPDLEPYNLILASLNSSQRVLNDAPEGESIAIVRPWLQDFTATWLSNYQAYGPGQIREQIDGVYDAGYDEWMLWNGSNSYTRDGLLKE